jgi:hypothetical protein
MKWEDRKKRELKKLALPTSISESVYLPLSPLPNPLNPRTSTLYLSSLHPFTPSLASYYPEKQQHPGWLRNIYSARTREESTRARTITRL